MAALNHKVVSPSNVLSGTLTLTTLHALRTAAFSVVVVAGITTVAPQHIYAQAATDAVPSIENSKYQFSGVVNAPAFLRSGPSDNDYPTQKLDKGDSLTVVGIRYDWLKIAPPEGSFCYVAKAYVEKRGDGKIGRATQLLNVRIGSSLNTLKSTLALKLEPNTDVQIIGEAEEYFKIKPPEGVYFYVNKQFVDPVRPLNPPTPPVAEKTPDIVVPPSPTETKIDPKTEAKVEPNGPTPGGPGPVVLDKPNTEAPTTGPTVSTGPGNTDVILNPTTNPSGPLSEVLTSAKNDEELFDTLEKLYDDASNKPIDQQPLTTLLAGYQRLEHSDKIPEALRRIAESKAKSLALREEAHQTFLDIQKAQVEMKARQTARQAEREEIEERIKQGGVTFYSAVGTLRQSSLQQGPTPLFRLTDPTTGRTIVYLRSDDAKLNDFVGKFIGVTGDVVSDAQLNLKIITPTKYEITSADKVFKSVAAQIVPPSLIPGGITAKSGTEATVP